MVFIAIWAFAKQDLERLLAPIDDDGNFCGLDAGYENHPYVYWPDITAKTNFVTKYVCVSACPVATDTTVDCITTDDVTDCSPNSYVAYNTFRWLGRFCMPDTDNEEGQDSSITVNAMKEAYESIYEALNVDLFLEYINDVWRAWAVILICLVFAFVACFLLIWIMEKVMFIFAWVTIILTFVVIMGISTWCWFYSDTLDEGNSNRTYMKVFAGIGWAIGAIFALLVCCFCKSFRIAIAILEAAADFVTDTLRVLIIPVTNFFAIIIWTGIWLVIAICNYSVGEITHSSTTFKQVEWEPTTRYFWYLSYFGYLWWCAMIIAISQFIIIVAVCTWYFSHAGDKDGSASVFKGFKWTFRYHFGTLAFGSAVLAIVWFIRTIFEYVSKKLTVADPSQVVKVIAWVCSVCLYCFN